MKYEKKKLKKGAVCEGNQIRIFKGNPEDLFLRILQLRDVGEKCKGEM